MRAWAAMGLALGVSLGLTGCGTAGLTPSELGITARDALVEARTRAGTWDSNARLRWVEGLGITPAGVALPGAGQWRLHYTAPGRQVALVVTVAPLQTGEEERTFAPPPGYEIGQSGLPDTWMDSPQTLARILAVRGGGVPENATMLLVPGQPEQWVVMFPDDGRRWRLNAQTGEVLTP
jgi:hypothetical protein